MPGPERRKQILEGAKRVFAHRGYHETHVRHICEDLGIGRGTLYQYFNGKQELFAAVVEDMLERLRTHIAERGEARYPQERPADAEIAAYSAHRLRQVLEEVFVDEASLRILLREAVALDVHIDAVVRAIDDVVVDACARDVERAQAAGYVRPEVDARRVAVLVVGGISKLAMDALSRDEPVDLDAIVRTASHVHLFGLLARGHTTHGGDDAP